MRDFKNRYKLLSCFFTRAVTANQNRAGRVPYFLTLTVQRWYYIFDRHNRWQILLDSLRFCQERKGVKVFAFVFMLNHIHLIAESPDLPGFLRDFKKHTALELMKNMKATELEVAKLFLTAEGRFSIWQQGNMPVGLESDTVFAQKKMYIEMSPVRKNYVEVRPEHWKYSSAHPRSTVQIYEVGNL